jgi:hypothetical protein
MRSDFQERMGEVHKYLDFVKALDSKRFQVVESPSMNPALDHLSLQELLKTLKANSFLLLYNLVESTVKNAIEAIFDRLSRESVSYDTCRSELQRVVLKNLRAHNVKKIHIELRGIAVDIVAKTFRKETLFSGNVDAREIRDTAKEFGFLNPIANGNELLTVKANRNDLAHGDKTFAAVGADYDVPRLLRIAKDIHDYLEEFVTNIENYLRTKAYLASGAL